MNIKQTLLVVLLSYNLSYSQTKLNLELKTELDSIYKADQIIREYVDESTLDSRKSEIESELGYKFANINDAYIIMAKNDSINIMRIEILILKHGYAGKSLVGEPTNETMWYVIQHSNKIKKYYPLIEKAGIENELPKKLVAKMYDRILVEDGKEQVYGTQGRYVLIKNKKTGIDQLFKYIQPIENPDTVNDRRKKMGFKTTVEENALAMGITYREYTFKDLEKIFKENDIIN